MGVRTRRKHMIDGIADTVTAGKILTVLIHSLWVHSVVFWFVISTALGSSTHVEVFQKGIRK